MKHPAIPCLLMRSGTFFKESELPADFPTHDSVLPAVTGPRKGGPAA